MLSAVVRSPSACHRSPASNAAGRSSPVRTSWTSSFTPRGATRTLQFPYLGRGDRVYEIRDHEDSREFWHRCLQYLETLGREPRRHKRQAGDIASRSGQARDEPTGDRIAERDYDNRDRVSRVPRGLSRRGRGDDDDVRLETEAVGGESGKPLAMAVRGEVIEGDGLP